MSSDFDHPHRPRRSPRRRGSARSAGKDSVERVFDALREENQGGVSPDVSDAVMARLGYQRTSRRAAMRERIRSVLGRFARSAMVLAAVGGTLWLVHSVRIERHRPSSVEEVVRASLARQGELLGNVANGVRPLDRLLNVDEPAPEPVRRPFERAWPALDETGERHGEDQMPAIAPHKRA